MDGVLMTTPAPGTSARLRSRLRSAASTICARSHRPRGATSAKVHPHRHHHHNHHHPVVNNINNQIKPSLLGLVHSGAITREVYNAWCGRLGDVSRIPGETVQALFNDMHLYPSKSQVVEMLQCARQCGRRNSSQFLTFGEFCVFASELRRGGRTRQLLQQQQHLHSNQTQQRPMRTEQGGQCEVFLGGSCNPTTWRADVAIPALSALGISYYNPQVSTWGPELMAAEHAAKESAAVLLFVCDSQTRCVAGMLEVAHLVAKRRCLVLVVHPFIQGQAIMDETLSNQEFTDLSEGQGTLLTLVRAQGITVHTNLTAALQSTVNMLRGPDAVAERKLTDKLMRLREAFDSADTNRTGTLSLAEVSTAYHRLTNSSLRIDDLYAIMRLADHARLDDVRINFEQFCGVVAEFTTDHGCNGTTTTTTSTAGTRPSPLNDEWVNQPLQRQTSANNNTNFEANGTGAGYVRRRRSRYDVYLGGSCVKRTTWRQRIAIPLLRRRGITYYNPSLHEDAANANANANDDADVNDNAPGVVHSASRDLLHDMDCMHDSKVVLFVITNETRSITSMILAAHYIALRRDVVLCVQQLPLDNCTIGSDVLTKQAIKDYNRARAYLTDLAKHENVSIFEDVTEAVECAIRLSQAPQR